MRIGTPLGLIAWQLMLTDSIRAMHRFGDNPHSLSNIELLVPLVVSDGISSDESDASAAGERYERARFDRDMPFSDIPASAFVLDESALPVGHKKKREHSKHSRKQDLAFRPRSVYLESLASEASDEGSEQGDLGADVWRACRRLTRAQAAPPHAAPPHAAPPHELLLLLCAELLDTPPAPPCPCCQQSPAPLWPGLPISARRQFLPIGDDSYLVQSYLKKRNRKRRYRMPDPSQQ